MTFKYLNRSSATRSSVIRLPEGSTPSFKEYASLLVPNLHCNHAGLRMITQLVKISLVEGYNSKYWVADVTAGHLFPQPSEIVKNAPQPLCPSQFHSDMSDI